MEKLIARAEAPTKKEESAAAPEAAAKPREKTPSRSTEKEVKFKLPPEDMEDEEVEEEEEVEIVRPPTPPKTLSKAKPKSVMHFSHHQFLYLPTYSNKTLIS